MSSTQIFVTNLDQLYKTYTKRINPDCWRELFNDPTALGDDNFGDVAEALFKYLPVHYMMPNSVYEVIDEEFGIRENMKSLSAFSPEGFLSFAAAKANNEYNDFDYEALLGTPAYDENGVVDLFINTLKELMHPECNIEDVNGAFGSISNSGMTHPWLVFYSKRRDFLAGKMTKEQEGEFFDLFMEEVPAENHQVIYPAFTYRVYESRGLICQKNKDYDTAFYYYRKARNLYDNDSIREKIESVSDDVVKKFVEADSIDMYEWDVFLDAARIAERYVEAIDVYEANIEEIKTFSEFAFILANISEFYAKENRTLEAIRTADIITSVDEDYMDAFMTREIVDWCYELIDEDGYNGTEVFEIMSKHCERFKAKFDADKNGLYDILYSEGVANCRYGNSRYAIVLFNELKDMIDRNDMEWTFTDLSESKVRVMFNLYNSYLTCRKCPSSEQVNVNMVKEAFEMALQGEDFAFSYGNMQFLPAFWNGMIKCCAIIGEYDRSLQVLLKRESQLKDMQNGDESVYSVIFENLYFNTIVCFSKLGQYDLAREAMFKLVGDFNLSENNKDLVTIDLTQDHEKLVWIFSLAVAVPQLFEAGEALSVVKRAISKIDFIKENKDIRVIGIADFMRCILEYAPAITDDHKMIYDAFNDEEIWKAAFISDDGRYDAKHYARICFFVGDMEGAKKYAAKAIKLYEKNNAYCKAHKVKLEDAVEDGQRYNNRIELSELSECYLLMGDVQKARYYVSKMEGDAMCAYCAKNGCLEKYLDYAQIECYEGNFDKALEYCDMVDKTEWHGHEEVAGSIRLYIKRQRGE